MQSFHRHFNAQIEVLSPVHIGDGQTYLRDFDYIVHQGSTWVLDKQKYFDFAVPDENKLDEALLLGKPADVVPRDKLDEVKRYRMAGQPEKSELKSHIKNAYGQVYIPGSSLKGLLRTSIFWGTYKINERRPDLNRRGRNRSWAAQPLEQAELGRNPNFDILRAIHVSDSNPAELNALRVTGTQIYPTNTKGNQGVIVDAEVIREESQFLSRITFERYGFRNDEALEQLEWQGKEELLQYITAFPHEFTRVRLQQELDYYKQRADDELKPVYSFYRQLIQQFNALEENQFMAQIGWGTGWNSKSLNDFLLADEKLFAEMVRQYRMRGRISDKFQAGMRFPSSRTLVRHEGRFVRPMGWIKVTLT